MWKSALREFVNPNVIGESCAKEEILEKNFRGDFLASDRLYFNWNYHFKPCTTHFNNNSLDGKKWLKISDKTAGKHPHWKELISRKDIKLPRALQDMTRLAKHFHMIEFIENDLCYFTNWNQILFSYQYIKRFSLTYKKDSFFQRSRIGENIFFPSFALFQFLYSLFIKVKFIDTGNYSLGEESANKLWFPIRALFIAV